MIANRDFLSPPRDIVAIDSPSIASPHTSPPIMISSSFQPSLPDIDTIDSPSIASPHTSPPIMISSSLEPSLPASPFFYDDDSMDDEMETNISLEDNTNKDVSTFKRSGDAFVLREGMEFASLQEFECFYYNVALSEGYTVRIRRTTNFPHSDKIRYRQYVCSCAGFCEEKKSNDKIDLDKKMKGRRTSTRRSGCRANTSVSNKNGIWKVGRINKDHNHLLVSPNSRIHLKKPGGMPSVAKNLVEMFSKTDLPIGRVPNIVNCDASINVSQRECWNHRVSLRRKNLVSGDASAVLQYCIDKRAQDPNFIYQIQTDEEDRMVNFFWIDSTARQYYERYGDVLVFDTTYKTNKYGLPLGNFVGVNNHAQSIMFGFALLQNEQEETFVWLFETWLHAVGGKLPVSILTDQDRAIQNAIRKVFPTVSHRFCLWHIMNKFPEKYSCLYKENSPFCRDMKNCLYNSITTEQFDNTWKKIMEDYKLTEDEWLNNLFNIRQSWVPVYNRTIFYAGMNTTQRCESIHAFFDSFLNKGTTLREFVIKYEHALERRYRAEHEERFASIYKNQILKLNSLLEQQAANVYTRSMFKDFQVELMESINLQKEKLEKSGSSRKYNVSNFQCSYEAFVVTVDVESREASCQCHLFEFKGILCRHILAIFSKKDITIIPPNYILPRWTKKAGEGISFPLFKKESDKFEMVHDLKFNSLMSQLRSHLHVSTNAFDIIMEALDGALKRVLSIEENQEGNRGATTEASDRVENSIEHPSIADPLIAKTKGRKKDVQESKNGRFRSGFEVRMENSKKAKRQCKNCGQYGHYSSTCARKKHAGVMEDAPSQA